MPENYYRVDLRLPQDLNEKLEKFQAELLEKTGKKLTKNIIIREMVRSFLEIPSSSCFQDKKKT